MLCPPKYSPRSQRPEPHTSTRQAGFCFTARASLLVVGRLRPPLRTRARCCHLARLRCVLCSPRPQGVAPNASPLRPPPKRRSTRDSPGLLICMGGKSRPISSALSEESTSSSEWARSSERVCIRPLSQLQPTSSSTASGCSHTPTRPSPRMRSVASPRSPSCSRLRGDWMVRVSGLKVHSIAQPCW